jgi:NAD(P)-dependent dehydrogenase (short-subunit alcohol dehydrogenase family)
LTREQEVGAAIDKAVKHFGGVDMLVLNAGIFPACRRSDIASDLWRMADERQRGGEPAGDAVAMRSEACAARRPHVVIGRRTCRAWTRARRYSASKAAMNQLARASRR